MLDVFCLFYALRRITQLDALGLSPMHGASDSLLEKNREQSFLISPESPNLRRKEFNLRVQHRSTLKTYGYQRQDYTARNRQL